jgi:hypothetical protein
MKNLIALVLAFQLSGLPASIAFAQTANDSDKAFQSKLQSKVVKQLQTIEKDGWTFTDQHQNPVSMDRLLISALESKSFYAVTPYMNDIKGRLTVRVQLDGSTPDALVFKLSVLSKDGIRIVSSRKFTIALDAARAEETKLKFARTLNSMAAEIHSDKDYAQNSKGVKSVIAAVSGLLIPSAHAGMDHTAAMLKTVASGACTIGILLLAFGNPNYTTNNGKFRLNPTAWFTLAAFVIGGSAYILSGIVQDLD